MKKIYLTIFLLSLISVDTFAQSGRRDNRNRSNTRAHDDYDRDDNWNRRRGNTGPNSSIIVVNHRPRHANFCGQGVVSRYNPRFDNRYRKRHARIARHQKYYNKYYSPVICSSPYFW